MIEHKGTVLIETERLKLRRFSSEDISAVYENWASLPEVAEFLSWKPHSSKRVTEQLVATWVHQYKFDTNYNWAMELKDGKSFSVLVGNIAATRRTEESAELAYLIAPRFWGMGFAAESVKAVCTFLFNEVGFTRIILNIPNENAKSRRVAEKCGFSLVGISPHAATDHSGKSLDICNYELKSNNFKKGLR